MTGVVGPNGCGKSNLVEAMKWVMGETSAKQMRGSEMEDVIFSGAGTRPARNIAEVVLTLDNKTRTAPAMVNDSDQLDVVRRIERGHGSAYSVNGREIRPRDVQTLFADAATGSRSTALVSQGRIGTLINAKPIDRRTIIDEAAGITGLHARRHEAELRLRAAEQNLARLQDVLVALDEQHKGLKRQARQASRYRNLSDHIRRAEAAVLALKLARRSANWPRPASASTKPRPPSPISRAWSALPRRRRPRRRPRCRRCATTRPPRPRHCSGCGWRTMRSPPKPSGSRRPSRRRRRACSRPIPTSPASVAARATRDRDRRARRPARPARAGTGRRGGSRLRRRRVARYGASRDPGGRDRARPADPPDRRRRGAARQHCPRDRRTAGPPAPAARASRGNRRSAAPDRG